MDEKQEAILKDLRELCAKHGLREAAFVCSNSEGKFGGFPCIKEDPSYGEIYEATMNIGRLWQHSKGVARDLLDEFDKRK